MLRWRVLLGAVFIAVLVGVFWLDFVTSPPAAWLLVLALGVGLAGAQEVISLLAAAGHHPLKNVIYGGTLLVIASNAIPLFWVQVPESQPQERLGWPLAAFAVSLLAAFVGEMRRYRAPGGVIVNVALATFAVAYIGVLLSFAIQLRVLGGPTVGMVGVIAFIAVVKLSDIGAYTVGRLIGRHKMAPYISPGKTMEGAAVALAFACLTAWVCFQFVPARLGCTLSRHPLDWVVFGIVVGGAGMAGDLAESLFKRDVGRKDSSTWLPGFGGVLDLLDSLLFAAPVAYLCWLLEMR